MSSTKPHAAGADGIGSDGRVLRPNVGAGLLATLASVFSPTSLLLYLKRRSYFPTSRRLSLLLDKLPKELPSGDHAPPLVKLDLDFSAIRKEGVWPHAAPYLDAISYQLQTLEPPSPSHPHRIVRRNRFAAN